MQRTTDQLWATIGPTFERLKQEAPNGYVPLVEVQLLDGEMLVPGTVQEIPRGSSLRLTTATLAKGSSLPLVELSLS
jgi:hypothetical protein